MKLRAEAVTAMRRAYAPYSHYLVGAAVRTRDGRVFEGVNPAGVQVTSFRAPAGAELEHDYLWRIHAALPRHGLVGVFNRGTEPIRFNAIQFEVEHVDIEGDFGSTRVGITRVHLEEDTGKSTHIGGSGRIADSFPEENRQDADHRMGLVVQGQRLPDDGRQIADCAEEIRLLDHDTGGLLVQLIE